MNTDIISEELLNKAINKGFKCKSYEIITIYDIIKWLRKEKKIHLFVEIANKGWYYTIYPNIHIEDGKLTCDKYILGQVPFKSYEEAVIAGIEYVIDNLI